MEGGLLFQVIIGVASVTYSVAFGIVAQKLWSLPKRMDEKLAKFGRFLERRFDVLEEEIKNAHDRLEVHDRMTSNMIGKDIDSRSIAESGDYPEMRRSNV